MREPWTLKLYYRRDAVPFGLSDIVPNTIRDDYGVLHTGHTVTVSSTRLRGLDSVVMLVTSPSPRWQVRHPRHMIALCITTHPGRNLLRHYVPFKVGASPTN